MIRAAASTPTLGGPFRIRRFMRVKFHWLFLVGIVTLTLASLIADVGAFLTPWPLNMYVLALAVLLLFPGGILFVAGAIRDWRALKDLLSRSKGITFLVLALTIGALVYLNLRSRVSTAQHTFEDDPIVIITQRGWPFALSSKEYVTEFEYVESRRFGEGPPGSDFKYARMQKEFSREGFVDRSFAWPMNVLHWFLILFGMLVVSRRVGIPAGSNRLRRTKDTPSSLSL